MGIKLIFYNNLNMDGLLNYIYSRDRGNNDSLLVKGMMRINSLEDHWPTNVIYQFIDTYKDQLGKCKRYSYTALIEYIRNTRRVKLDFITKLEPDIGVHDRYREMTALMHYMYITRSPQIDIIMKLKKEIGMRDRTGNTALMYYMRNRTNHDPYIIGLLKDEIGMYNNYGHTALMFYTLHNDNIDIIRALRNEISMVDNHYNIALKYILKHLPNIEVLRMFKDEFDMVDYKLYTYLKYNHKVTSDVVAMLYDGEDHTVLDTYLEREDLDLDVDVLEVLKDEIGYGNSINLLYKKIAK